MVTARQNTPRFQQTDLVSIQDLTPYDIDEIFDMARLLKSQPSVFRGALAGKQFVMMFEKPSLRTRVTFEVGINNLGGRAIFMESPGGIEKREKISDVARNLERWVDGIILRTFKHRTVTEMAANAGIPVINGLTDLEHPCQALADYFTLREKFGDLRKIKLAYVGDGNNVAHSLMLTAAAMGSHISVATPPEYLPDGGVVRAALKLAESTGAQVEITHDWRATVAGANAVYTDVWTSMGQENEAGQRGGDFRHYQVNGEMMAHAAEDALFMHCLPAHRGDEVTDEVIDSPTSVVFDQAENRLHVQTAIMVLLASSAGSGKPAASHAEFSARTWA
ncbi:MAG: ornithine carbamoyltransferase [Candidatus Korobacteraceae bacterium]